MSRAALLFLLVACKESGPSAADLRAQKQQRCADAAPGVRRLEEQLRLVQQLDLPAVVTDQPSPVKLDLGAARTAVQWGGDGDSVIERCAEAVKECASETLTETFERCAAVDSALLVRLRVEEKAEVNEAMLNKYRPGRVAGSAWAFALRTDGGAPLQLGAVAFDWKLRGGVDVERDATTAERERALAEALRKEVLGVIEFKLAGAGK